MNLPDFRLEYDAEDCCLKIDPPAEAFSDEGPIVAYIDMNNLVDGEEIGHEQGRAIANAVNIAPALLAFVEQMARMVTPEDEIEALREEGMEYSSVDELISDMDADRLTGEYETFMEMVAQARKLLA